MRSQENGSTNRLTEQGDQPVGPKALIVRVGDSILEVERRLILATLEALDGDKPKAAQMLGVSLKTLYNRLNAYQAQAVLERADRYTGGNGSVHDGQKPPALRALAG